MADRPSHCTSFPISDPVIHEEGDRYFWNGLYGMNSMDISGLVKMGRSWAYAADLSVNGQGFQNTGYDRSRRCYRLDNETGKPSSVTFTLSGSQDSPVMNPAFHIKNWNAEGARVLVNGKAFASCEIGINHELEGTDLVVFLWLDTRADVTISIIPE
jgi:hypothetical protein